MKTGDLPSLPRKFVYRLDLRGHVTPRLLKSEPIHRWFWFPHSFSPQLINEILKAYPLSAGGLILDPFVGAGTTVLRASQLGYDAIGTDLSPLSLFVSRVKLALMDKRTLQDHLQFVLGYTPAKEWSPLPARLEKAFARDELAHIAGLRRKIDVLPQPSSDFFRLALLRVQQRASRAVQDGGWFRWVVKEDHSQQITAWFEQQASLQIADVEHNSGSQTQILLDDARLLEHVGGEFDLVITSPPYPNRHDYSRIFHIELLSLGIEESVINELRHSSIRSHVEAEAPPILARENNASLQVNQIIEQLPDSTDKRIPDMLLGYFEDIHFVLKAIHSHLRPDALCAFVVGNVRHAGVMVPVDEKLIEIGKQIGYAFEKVWVARLRGNSAQQMGRFGRKPARESVVFLRKC